MARVVPARTIVQALWRCLRVTLRGDSTISRDCLPPMCFGTVTVGGYQAGERLGAYARHWRLTDLPIELPVR